MKNWDENIDQFEEISDEYLEEEYLEDRLYDREYVFLKKT